MATEYLTVEARERLAALHGRRCGVVGLGREGIDLATFLARHGATIVISDHASQESLTPALARLSGLDVTIRIGEQHGADLLDCDEIFVSPGVPRELPVVADPAAAGIPISSATRLYFELCPGPIAGITGSSGKTTTTSMVGAIAWTAGLHAVVGGNIGVPMLARLDEVTPDTWSVLELSSFQLADMDRSPHVGAVLNITPNHLDRHPDMADYTRAKGNLVLRQRPDDTAVLNADDPLSAGLPHGSRTLRFSLQQAVDGAWLEHGQLLLGNPTRSVLLRDEVPLRGIHNVANALAAMCIASAMDCPDQAMASALRSFRPVPHRLEVVATIAGVTYVDDSIATSPERSMAALRAIDEPIVLIAGGRDKHLPMHDWGELIGSQARAVVTVGEAASLIERVLADTGFARPVVRASAFAQTVPLARELAQAGDVVLLSPGCTSFDEFRDFEARGEAFRAAVHALQEDS